MIQNQDEEDYIKACGLVNWEVEVYTDYESTLFNLFHTSCKCGSKSEKKTHISGFFGYNFYTISCAHCGAVKAKYTLTDDEIFGP
ncbi:MAG: hypothetical protein WC878_04335 [Candidatus Paceibacterota bacterium]|jgi:hypothetical protein